MRPFNEDRTWGAKIKKVNGKPIYTTDWNGRGKAEEWRKAWADAVNGALAINGHSGTVVDHRSYARQGVDKIPSIHLGVSATQMERKGISTERGAINRQIEITNGEIRQLKARISKLKNWLAEEAENITPPTLADVISQILNRQGQSGITRLKNASQMLIFLQENQIMDFAGLEKKVSDMFGKIHSLNQQMKPVERRLKTLDEHIKQAKIYLEYKGKKWLPDSERILFTAAKKYLNEHLNGHKLDLKKWKAERAEKTAERNQLNQKYSALKEEIKKVEQIRREVYDIMRSEQQGQKKEKTKDEVR
jgi:chromosome segregation ATPase